MLLSSVNTGEEKTRKRDKRKGLSSSDLAMKGCGTKSWVLKEKMKLKSRN